MTNTTVDSLELHPLTALFPELPPEELSALARDIQARGQLEPVVLHKGLILDGRNRYKACQMAGVEVKSEEFDAEETRRTPEEFILSCNLRRRHLTVGQKAVIALEWSERITFSPDTEKNRERGRPKGTLSETAEKIGINEQRAFEARQIRDANPALYEEVRVGKRSLTRAFAEISALRQTRFERPGLAKAEPTCRDAYRNGHRANGEGGSQGSANEAQPVGVRDNAETSPYVQKPAVTELPRRVQVSPDDSAMEKALVRIRDVLGVCFYEELKGGKLLKKRDEVVRLAELRDEQMLEVRRLLKMGWKFTAAFQELSRRLRPEDEIRMLHTRALARGGNCYMESIGDFTHLVVCGPQRDRIVAELGKVITNASGLGVASF